MIVISQDHGFVTERDRIEYVRLQTGSDGRARVNAKIKDGILYRLGIYETEREARDAVRGYAEAIVSGKASYLFPDG